MRTDNLGFHCHGLDHFHQVIVDNGLKRGEFYNFPPHELAALKREIARYRLAFSIHAPLVKPPWYPSPPTWSFLCDVDEAKRRLSLRMVAETMQMAGELGAEYVVVHFPVPSSTEPAGVSLEREAEIAWQTASDLADMARSTGVAIHMEGFGPSPLLSVAFLGQVVQRFPMLRCCFDCGHMSIAAQRDGFDLYEFAAQLRPHIGSVHLWNGRNVQDYMFFRHIPVHPSQDPGEGWVDIPALLRLVLGGNGACPVILESGPYYPPALGHYDVDDGVRWVKDIVAALP